MHSIKNIFAAAAALAITTVGAQAADLPLKAAPMAAVIPQATGYVEVYGGGARTNYDSSDCFLNGFCEDPFNPRFDGVVLGGAGRATYWFTPYVSTQLDAQAEGTNYNVPSGFDQIGGGHFSNHSYLIAGHLNARNSQQGLIGLFAGAGDAGGSFFGIGPSQRHVIFGAEGQYYWNNFTAYLQGGYDTTINTVGFGTNDVGAWFIRGTGRYFVTPNLMLEGTGLYANGKINLDTSGFFPSDFPASIGFQTFLWQAKAEWRFDTMPFSVFAKYQGSQTKYDAITFDRETTNTKVTDNRFLLGLRLYMGENTLLSNDRKGSTLDIIDPLGTATGPLMFAPSLPRSTAD